jgi:hypothetical protein
LERVSDSHNHESANFAHSLNQQGLEENSEMRKKGLRIRIVDKSGIE